jgi:exonuclease III
MPFFTDRNCDFNILQWNCQGFYSKFIELQRLIKLYTPVCICLQEVHLGERPFKPPRGYTGFTSHSTQRLGSAILISSDVPSAPLSLRTVTQAVATRIFLGSFYTVCSIYIPPSEPVSKEELSRLIAQLPRPFLLLGDFNSRHPFC